MRQRVTSRRSFDNPAAMSIGELLQQGGWAMWPIYACSVVGVAVFVKKLIDLFSARIFDLGWFEGVLERVRAGSDDEALSILQASRHPASRVLAATLNVWRRRPDRAEAEARRVGSLEVQKAESFLALLSFIAQAAPLLGLLGTVLGMVDLFLGLQASGLREIDVSLLSSGIWKALLTTAAGLTVAVPSLGAYSYLAHRADTLRLQIIDLVQQLLTEMHTRDELEPLT